jgi:WS/DGAT/MGAT family acyltransferase
MAKAIPPLDLMFYLTETTVSPMHVGLVLQFDAARGTGADIAQKIVTAYRKAKPVAPFNLVPAFSLPRPRWVEATAIDMTYHVQHRTLAGRGDAGQLVQLIEELHTPLLERDRAGFRVWVIDGLERGGFAIYCKMHHALVDGISGVMRVFGSLNATAAAKRVKPFFAIELATSRPAVPRGRAQELRSLAETAWRKATAVSDLSANLVRAGLGDLFANRPAGNRPFTAPRTPMNAPLSAARSFATLQLPLDAMKAAGRPYGATLNDVAAAIVDAALHRYLADRGIRLDRPLVAGCAMSLREAGDTEAATKTAPLFVPLGDPEATLSGRIERIAAANAAAKAELRAVSKDAAHLYGLLAFGLVGAFEATGADGLVRPMANFVLSNVPGSERQLYLRGAPMAGSYPISALGMGVGLNVTLLSHAGTVNFGLLADGSALSDLDTLGQYTRAAFDALLAQSRTHAESATKGREPAPPRPRARRKADTARAIRRRGLRAY